MVENIIQQRKEGIYFIPGDFYLDPKKPVERAIISHGHADHAISSNTTVWCTPVTKGIMQLRYRERLKSVFNVYPYRQSFNIGDITITLLPAGHILGSSQVVIDYNNTRYCYTGDFKLRTDATCEPFETVPCDVLITETTFAQPGYAHPLESDEIKKLEEFEKINIVIGAYSLGKAQSLTKILSANYPARRIMVHPEASGFHRYYEQQGIKLGNWEPYNYQLFKRTTGNILIAPPRVMSTYNRNVGVVTAFATGWKKAPMTAHFPFYVSDHADWEEILLLIKQTGAKTILTVHGDGEQLKKHFEEAGSEISVCAC
jgi:putative mRNA 3-end processing factor